MTTPNTPQNTSPSAVSANSAQSPNNNKIGLGKTDYTGGKSTLCTGCGHDSLTNHIISAFFQSSINPYHVAKMSGIGCSSKTPGYFLSKSHGFNSVHGRMAPVAIGAKLANKSLRMIGVSGDGDTASIGISGFVHLIRRNLPIVYIVANNGVYGLTKGQFSATAEKGALQKSGLANTFEEIDLCSLAITLGCSFVARSFTGDAKQIVPLIQSALHHNGTAVIDVISPCITFNNLSTSLKSYEGIRDHKVLLQELGFIEDQNEIKVDYPEGDTQVVPMSDGSQITLKKLNSIEHDVNSKIAAIKILEEYRTKGQILTGLLYHSNEGISLVEQLSLPNTSLANLKEESSRPSVMNFTKILSQFK